MVNNSRKGAAFERAICRRLSLWISGHTRDDLYWRSPMSGGRSTRAEAARFGGRKNHAGDIVSQHPSGAWFTRLWFVECKHKRTLRLDMIPYEKQGQLEVIWWEPNIKAEKLGLLPLCICKADRQQELVLTTERGIEILSEGVLAGSELSLTAVYPHIGMYVLSFETLLSEVSPRKLKRARSAKVRRAR